MGDAYGAGFEFASVEKVEALNDLTQYCEHELGIAPGCYTDDTQMSVAIAELLVEKSPWTNEVIANKFVECFKRDERLGYSKGFYQFLKSVENGVEFLARIKSESTRNGAAMRSAPLGYVKTLDELIDKAEIQATITHDSEIGRKSSQAVALASHYFIYELGSKENLTEFVSQYTGFQWNDNWCSQVACCGEETVNALLTTLKKSGSLREILINSVSFCGDVDTVAAIGLGVGSYCNEYSSDLPPFLYNQLENGNYGKAYLEKMDKLLAESKNC